MSLITRNIVHERRNSLPPMREISWKEWSKYELEYGPRKPGERYRLDNCIIRGIPNSHVGILVPKNFVPRELPPEEMDLKLVFNEVPSFLRGVFDPAFWAMAVGLLLCAYFIGWH